VFLGIGRELGFLSTVLFAISPAPVVFYLLVIRSIMTRCQIDAQHRWLLVNLLLTIGLLSCVIFSIILIGFGLAYMKARWQESEFIPAKLEQKGSRQVIKLIRNSAY
jgi:hypothetical protein